MKNILLAILMLFSSNLYAYESIDGYEYIDANMIEFDGINGSPSTSDTNKAKVYFDVASGKLKCSENGGAYADCVGAGGGGGGSGTVNTGTAGRFTYYPSSGTTVDDLPIMFTNGTNIGVGTSSLTGAFLEVNTRTAATTGIQPTLRLTASSSGTTTNGYGTEVSFYGEIADGTENVEMARIQVVNNNVTGAQGDIVFQTRPFNATIEEVMRLSNTGNIGVGNDVSPDAMLEVQKIAGKTPFMVSSSSGGDGDYLKVDSNGNVGVGMTIPSGKLHVQSASSGATPNTGGDELVLEGSGISGLSILTPNTSSGRIYFGDPQNNDIGVIKYDHAVNAMSLFTSAAEQVVINSAGNVGIGTPTPKNILNVVKNQNAATEIDIANTTAGTGAYAGLRLTSSGGASGSLVFSTSPSYTGIPGYNSALVLDTGASVDNGIILSASKAGADINMFAGDRTTSRLFIEGTSGNVGIGTGSPLRKHQITISPGTPSAQFITTSDFNYLTAGTLLHTYFGAQTGNTFVGLQGADVGGASGADIVLQQSSSNVGIGTSVTGATVTVLNTQAINSLTVNDVAGDTTPFILDQSGNVGIQASTAPWAITYGNAWVNNAGGAATNVYTAASGTASVSVYPIANITTESTSTSPFEYIGLNLHNATQTANTYAPGLTWSHYESDASRYNSVAAGISVRSPTGAGLSNNYVDGEMTFWTGGVATAGIKPVMTLDNTFNVGIGTTVPAALLNVASTDSKDLFRVDDNGGGDTTPFVIDQNGNIGIGTARPAYKVTVGAPTNTLSSVASGASVVSSAANAIGIAYENTSASSTGAGGFFLGYSNDGAAMVEGDRLGGLLFGGSSSAANLRNTAGIVAYAQNNWTDGSSYPSYFTFETNSYGATARTEKVRITAAGSMGIGTASPNAILHVDKGTGVGQLTLDGSTGGCLMIRDTDDAGWTECDVLDGVMTCSIDADGICD